MNYITSQVPFTKTIYSIPNPDVLVQLFPLLSVGAGDGGARELSAGVGTKLTNLLQPVL